MRQYRFIETSEELLSFIENSPSCFHVIENFGHLLEDNGFTRLYENEEWKLNSCGKYYVTRNDSSIIAFRLPKTEGCEFGNFQITAAHSDSPCFRVKDNAEITSDGHYIELNTEKYGGMLMAPWFDRPLSVAGRVVVKEGNNIKSKLVNVDRDLCMIPSLPIHMNRDANEGVKLNPQKDTLPILSEESEKGIFKRVIAEAAEVDENQIISEDLYLYSRMPGSIWGADNEFMSSGKLDDLMCAYGCMTALMEYIDGNDTSVNVCCVFDNEEVGSGTKQGADSTFLSDTLERIAVCCNKTKQQYCMALAESMMISADNAHAVHPNYQEKYDSTNRAYMNQGVVVKFSANQKYTTDAVSAAVFREICNRAGVPVQTFYNRSDMAGGSTLGNISNSHISINTVDIGLPQLAMHSPYETAGIKDTEYLIHAVKEFYETAIIKNSNGTYILS